MKIAMSILAGLIFTVGIGANELEAQRGHYPAAHQDHHRTANKFRRANNGRAHVRYEIRERRVWVAATHRIERRQVQQHGYYRTVLEKRFDHHGHAYFVRVRRYVHGGLVWKNVRVHVPGHYEIRRERVAVRARRH